MKLPAIRKTTKYTTKMQINTSVYFTASLRLNVGLAGMSAAAVRDRKARQRPDFLADIKNAIALSP